MKSLLSILFLSIGLPLFGQTTLEEYRTDVAAYSRALKIAAAKSEAAAEEWGRARTGYLPRLSLDGDFTRTFRGYEGVKPWTFSVLPQLVQTLYGGGSVRATAEQASLGCDIALCEEEFSRLDVRYAAEYAYWSLSAVELYAESMRRYVSLIRSLKEVVDRRFAEGYIAKGDVLMIDARLSEAEFSLVSVEQTREVALHNFNILRGTEAAQPVTLAQGIRDSLAMPQRIPAAEAVARRPDYAAAQLRAAQAAAAVRVARSAFNPQVSVGVGGSWQPSTPNRDGKTLLDGSVSPQELGTFSPDLRNRSNSVRCRMLSRLFRLRRGHGARGCNMAFWRDDVKMVNGYDEMMTGWGHEDSEFAERLRNAGIRQHSLKFGGIAYHLHHGQSSREHENVNLDIRRNTVESRKVRCENGIDAYL